ncbi:hypothetical protein EDD11_009522 [Mortierella claussenii]|nr:hypothetical protein EDD11_009522 [Mortierella claussenii]
MDHGNDSNFDSHDLDDDGLDDVECHYPRSNDLPTMAYIRRVGCQNEARFINYRAGEALSTGCSASSVKRDLTFNDVSPATPPTVIEPKERSELLKQAAEALDPRIYSCEIYKTIREGLELCYGRTIAGKTSYASYIKERKVRLLKMTAELENFESFEGPPTKSTAPLYFQFQDIKMTNAKAVISTRASIRSSERIRSQKSTKDNSNAHTHTSLSHRITLSEYQVQCKDQELINQRRKEDERRVFRRCDRSLQHGLRRTCDKCEHLTHLNQYLKFFDGQHMNVIEVCHKTGEQRSEVFPVQDSPDKDDLADGFRVLDGIREKLADDPDEELSDSVLFHRLVLGALHPLSLHC